MKKKLFLLLILAGAAFFLLFKSDLKAVECSLKEIENCGDKECLQEAISNCQASINEAQGQIKTLASTLSYLTNRISLTELEIAKTEKEISLLKIEIEELSLRIDNLNLVLDQTAERLQQRVVSSYKRGQIKPFYYLLSARLSPANLKYMYAAEQQDKDLMLQMEEARLNYDQQKVLKETKQAEQESLIKKLAGQKLALAQQQQAKQQLLDQTKNNEKQFQNLLTEAKQQLAAIKALVSDRGGATLLDSQTFCDGWGCYYNQRDKSWGAMTLGDSNYSVAEYGCLASSVAMLAKHYGYDIDPADIAATSNAFLTDNGYLYTNITVKGININRTKNSASVLNGELSTGKPVIVGLSVDGYGNYYTPAHFIVIKEKSGDQYIMNDPWFEKAHDIPLTDYYSVSDIVRVDTISIN